MITEAQKVGEDDQAPVPFRLLEHATQQEKRMAQGLVRKDKKLFHHHNKLLRYHGLPMKKADDKSQASNKTDKETDKKVVKKIKSSSTGGQVSHKRSRSSPPQPRTKFPISEEPDD
ncbi:hypothetical protein Pmani_025982 [Petrolisthes manimaculis]|uniref:Uncharacterized protein n=1 Tax=Petrolisthes manimaculis TaxID=1843537 RepID=A0AAE1P757_9EUCA|nr:hypothetical protein Pmani_025982 [Petrolisthes manimaculis]